MSSKRFKSLSVYWHHTTMRCNLPGWALSLTRCWMMPLNYIQNVYHMVSSDRGITTGSFQWMLCHWMVPQHQFLLPVLSDMLHVIHTGHSEWINFLFLGLAPLQLHTDSSLDHRTWIVSPGKTCKASFLSCPMISGLGRKMSALMSRWSCLIALHIVC